MLKRSAESLYQVITHKALQLGFIAIGVTTPETPDHYNHFLHWLEEDRHGKMEYLSTDRSRQRRADPLQILPQCRSILCLATPYPPNHLMSPSKKNTGKVASYAWGRDYHDVLADRMENLVSFIEEKVGEPVPNRWYTDTGPILERDLAQRAGLGWIGKNTCLILPHRGSYIFLAEILLGLELPPDSPFTADQCGSCHRCLDACPTKCILPDRTIDSRRCISYLTIELKSIIPEDLRPLMGNWVFGCDICQQVCPWNRFADPDGDPAFAPIPSIPAPDLVQELKLTAEEFNNKFRGNPIKRAKRSGYLRNVAIALANHAEDSKIPIIQKKLQEIDEPLVREHLSWALNQLIDQGTRPQDISTHSD